MHKKIHILLDKSTNLSLSEVLEKIRALQEQHPDLDVFFDGDEYAICSRPRRHSK
ncbi:MAG: hypothetical protein OEV21_04950 [Thermoplasmata archaeon]|nr:hypothetical protein [Thermoplasmata archaeon]